MAGASATNILIELLGAVALLLWGTRMVRTGVLRAFGTEVRRLIRVSLGNRLKAFLAGLGVTGMLQSSTATALVVTSFAGRGLVETGPALAVMLGADLGTSIVAQVLAFDIGWLSPLLILAGVVSYLGTKGSVYREVGRVVIGLGLMLLALRLILAASAPLREATLLRDLLGALADEALITLLLAALLSWLAHSSLAIVLLVMSLASAGALSLPEACTLVLGANIGSTMPVLVATYAAGPPARRVAVGNFLFKLVGCLAVLPLVGAIVPLLEQLDAGPARVVVNFHTGFNLGLGICFILLTDAMAKLCTRLLPDAPVEADPSRPRHLDRSTLDSPSLALACAAREALRMGDMVEAMLRDSFAVLESGDRRKLARTAQQDDVVDKLHEAVKLFVTDVTRERLSPDESRRAAEILLLTTNLEHIGDIIDKSLLELAGKKMRKQLQFSGEGRAELEALHSRVMHNLQLALGVFVSGDVTIARRLVDEKVTMREAERQAAENHLARLRAGRTESIDSSALHLDVLRDLKRIHSHICAVAYPLLDDAGQLHRSRLKRIERRAFDEDEPSPAPTQVSAGPDPPGAATAPDRDAAAEAATAPRRRRSRS